MSAINHALSPATHRGQRQSPNHAPILPRFAAYGKALTDRQQFGNRPRLVVVCIGGNAWNSAKSWNLKDDVSALVLTHEQAHSLLHWPVKGCQVIIEWGLSAPKQLIVDLVKCLLRSGAKSATIVPTWVDFATRSGGYDTTQSTPLFVPERQTIKTYFAEVSHA
ncbi:hypothetical protein ABXJ76_15050 [Methylobacter sp. G7]|uniref:hypothetical protein n=1 Tax=Methylobacter sp. G7 TaxID=3230117 RepID=UPI003D804FF8